MRAEAPAPNVAQEPTLTLPPAEAAFLRDGYAKATTILEYGSGGSTAMAAQMPGKVIWSVESDLDWMKGLEAWFSQNPPQSEVHLRHGDIGPTGKWGRPRGTSKYARFHHYPIDVWEEDGFSEPDTVLIDGRFRAGCFLTVAYRVTRPVTVYFDDYTNRPAYHVVERFGAPVETAGRMARFDLAPQQVKPEDLAWIMDVYAQVQ
ncbi:hypothetical protein [Flavimaricola marinus]|uniref:Methyltransferase n=1 Tax=Flavimaricola marinus TaxID=1819565 RepID=A0A238LF64_9RHOB|nr:hypothetical protein [Flavimaricola marinus]SMY07596.1 hypothetical protein LOM8899_01733 [Flavimaricola marinus]